MTRKTTQPFGRPQKGRRNWGPNPNSKLSRVAQFCARLNMGPDADFISQYLETECGGDPNTKERIMLLFELIADRRMERAKDLILQASFLDRSLLRKGLSINDFTNITSSARNKLSNPIWLEGGEQVVLIGKTGSGKTQCAHVLSQLAIDSKGYDVLYVHSSPIIGPDNKEGKSYPPYVRCMHVDLLVIDNIGRDDASKDSAELLESLLHWRIEMKLPTIITMSQEMNSTLEKIQSNSDSSSTNNASSLIDFFIKFMSQAYKIHMAPTNYYRDQALARSKEVKD